ncbi:MAG: prolipoprotein diacylglyceryl transferase [Oscillospiraceae bacterium]
MSTIVSFPGLGIEFPLNRVAFSIGNFEIYWYGVLIGLGLALGIVYALKKSKEFGIDSDRMLDVIIIGTIVGVIGARLYYVVFAPAGEFTSIMDVLNMRKGGVAFYGMVIFAVLSAVITCRIRKVKLLPMLDVATIGFLIGQGIGRWGNFINQEAFGCNTRLPWGMTSDTVVSYLTNNAQMLTEKGVFVDPMMPVHPTFLYESLWCLLGFVILSLYVKNRKFDGEIALMYFAWNGFGRAFIEGLRTDSLYLGNVRISQVLAIVGAISAMIAILIIRVKIRKRNDPEYLMPYGRTEQCKIDLALIAKSRTKTDSSEAEVSEEPDGQTEMDNDKEDSKEAVIDEKPEITKKSNPVIPKVSNDSKSEKSKNIAKPVSQKVESDSDATKESEE